MRNLLYRTLKQWWADDPFTYSAAISYYTLFSFPALLICLLQLSSLIAIKTEFEFTIYEYLSQSLGPDAAEPLRKVIESQMLYYFSNELLIVGVALLLYAALRIFLQLQKSFNRFWRTKENKKNGILSIAKQHLIALAVMISMGFILITSRVVSAMVSVLDEWFKGALTLEIAWIAMLSNALFSLLTIGSIFTIMIKLLPDCHVRWRSALLGGATAALLFILGEYAMRFYFELANPSSTYGVAGSFIILMLWVTYSSLILFFGAHFAHQHQLALRQHKDDQDVEKASKAMPS